MDSEDLRKHAEHYMDWLCLGLALSDTELLQRVDPQWWRDEVIREVVIEVKQRLADRTQELPALTGLLRNLGAVAWNMEGTIPSVEDAKERIEDRLGANHLYRQARVRVCRMFGVEDWALDWEWQTISTEEKLDIVARVLRMNGGN